jgi:hypothetical protein
MNIATAVRASIPLGLMRNDHNDGPTVGSVMKPGHSLLPPPTEDWDREERRVLMFTVLMFDINASSSSGWPNMMMTDELVSQHRGEDADAVAVYKVTLFEGGFRVTSEWIGQCQE